MKPTDGTGTAADQTAGEGSFRVKAGDPTREAPSRANPEAGEGTAGAGDTSGGSSATGIEREDLEGVGAGESDLQVDVPDITVSGVAGGKAAANEPDNTFIDEAPAIFVAEESVPVDGKVPVVTESDEASVNESESTPSDDRVFLERPASVIPVPELEFEAIDFTDDEPEEVEIIKQVQDPVQALRGAWSQTSPEVSADFGPGGTDQRLLVINPALGTIEIRCYYGSAVRMEIYGVVAFESDRQKRITLVTDSDRQVLFDDFAMPAPGGGTIQPPALGPGSVVAFEALDETGQAMRIGDREYERIDLETYRDMRRGNSGVLAVPAPPVIASGDDGGDGQEVQGVEPEFFGIKAVGRRICFICDGSGSMGAHFSQLKTELVRLVASLPEGTQFVVMFFSGKTIGSLKWRSAGAQGARSLEKDLADTTSGGSSDPTDAIKIAFQMKKVPDTIFLLTDGQIEPRTPRVIKGLNSTGGLSRVHTVLFGSSAGGSLLQQVASENGGDFRHVNPGP